MPEDDDVCYYICWRLKLEGETEKMGVCTKELKGVTAAVLMATRRFCFYFLNRLKFAGADNLIG